MLKGKNAVVTGSTSGIGLGLARAFAKDGANVLINGFGPADAIERRSRRLVGWCGEIIREDAHVRSVPHDS